jgi:serine/threonine protein kinase
MYRPPEMVDVYLKYPIDGRVDIWMLGCVLFVMNYRYHPFQDSGKLSIVNANIRYPNTASEKMQKFIRHMLTPNPYFRPTLDEVIDIVEKWDCDDF